VEHSTHIKIPMERVGVLIGPHGETKKRIEETLQVDSKVDGESGDVEIRVRPNQSDVSVLLAASNIVRAIGRGFSPWRAWRLRDEDNELLILDLEDYVGRSRNAQNRVKGRIIGKRGKSRAMLEELTECAISVYGGTVAIIGTYERLPVAKEAVEMLIGGAFHKTVWNHLYSYRRKLKKERGELWFEPRRRARSG